MEFEFEEDAPARGLRRYARLVTDALGLSGECFSVQLQSPANVYLALQERLDRFPTDDVALLWDEEHGWSVAVEMDGGADMVVLSYLEVEVLPPPRVVARFVTDVFADEHPGDPLPHRLRRVDAEDVLPQRLAAYALPALRTRR